MISKVTKDVRNYSALSKLLTVMQLTMKGTPFIVKEDEMGLSNYAFTSMEQIKDVEAKGYYNELLEKGKSPEEAFAIILAGTREHCRVLLPWNEKLPSYHEGKFNNLIFSNLFYISTFHYHKGHLLHQILL